MLITLSDVEDKIRDLPPLPSWLEAMVEKESDDTMQWLEDESILASSMYSLFRRARQGNAETACLMAQRFETGEVPGGPSLDDAMLWYEHAAQIGSAKAAYRLAVLQAWQSPKEPLAGYDMALLALQNISNEGKSFRWRSEEGWSLAAKIVLHALQKGVVNDGNQALDNLMVMEGFRKHPDFEEIAALIRKLSRGADPNLNMLVVSAKIVDEGDFRAGIYRKLEKPISLVPTPIDVSEINTVLDTEFPWFASINALVCRQLAASQFGSKPAFKVRPLLLAGAPGVGKTTWVKRLAELCEVPFRAIMAAGNNDVMFLRGTPRGWSSARPGAVLQTMATELVANPIFLVDELEKSSPDSRNGRLWDVLLQLLEPSSAKTYLDECLQVPADLSWVSWIATANELGNIPKPLLDRFTIVVADSPGDEHFKTIVRGSITRYAKELGIDQRMLPQLTQEEVEVLQTCKSPREISRTVALMMEKGLVSEYRQIQLN
jgi:hypothetical protein